MTFIDTILLSIPWFIVVLVMFWVHMDYIKDHEELNQKYVNSFRRRCELSGELSGQVDSLEKQLNDLKHKKHKEDVKALIHYPKRKFYLNIGKRKVRAYMSQEGAVAAAKQTEGIKRIAVEVEV